MSFNHLSAAALVALGIVAAGPAGAVVTYTTTGGTNAAADPGPVPNSTILENFDGVTASGVTLTSYWLDFVSGVTRHDCAAVGGDFSSCNSAIAMGSSVGTTPPTGDASNFLSVSIGPDGGPSGVGFADLNFSPLAAANKINNISFYWGSIDAWNFVELLDANGNLIPGSIVHGTDLGAGTTDGFFGSLGSTRFTYYWDPATDPVAKIEFGDFFGKAMELDTVTSVLTVPEPASLVLLALGLAGLGASRRRKLI